jgi:hypothetical protein
MVMGRLRRRWQGMLGPHRRWIVINAILVSAAINLVLNAAIAWVSVLGQRAVPLWSVPLLGGQSTVVDTVCTLFVLPLTTCLMCTSSVWQELRSGRLTPLRKSTCFWSVIAHLPARRLRRGVVLGALSVLVFAPPVVLLMTALDVGDLSIEGFMIYKVSFAVVLGAMVTPLIAARAMTDAIARPAAA